MNLLDYCYSKCCPICNVFGSYPHLCSRCKGCFFVQDNEPKENNLKAVCTISCNDVKKWYLELNENEKKQFILDKSRKIRTNLEMELFKIILQDFYNGEDIVTWSQPARSGKQFDLDLSKSILENLCKDKFKVYNPPIGSKEEIHRKYYEAINSTMLYPNLYKLVNRIRTDFLKDIEFEMGE